MEDHKKGNQEFPFRHPPPLQVPGGLVLSDSEKAEALADSPEVQLQPVDDPSDPAFTEMVDEALRAYKYAPASEPTLTIPSEVLQAHQWIQGWQGSGPERYTEEDPETSS
jgi:hypothetical protein